MQFERSFAFSAIDPDEFLVGGFAGVDFEKALRRFGETQSDFFPDFANLGRVVIFAGFHVAGSGGIPHAGLAVSLHRTPLQKDLAARAEHEHVHGAMQQAEAMHFAARLAVDYFVAFVDDVENVFGHKKFLYGFKLALTPALSPRRGGSLSQSLIVAGSVTISSPWIYCGARGATRPTFMRVVVGSGNAVSRSLAPNPRRGFRQPDGP